jgi:hypothetical protein
MAETLANAVVFLVLSAGTASAGFAGVWKVGGCEGGGEARPVACRDDTPCWVLKKQAPLPVGGGVWVFGTVIAISWAYRRWLLVGVRGGWWLVVG